jgi:hypothetical protein
MRVARATSIQKSICSDSIVSNSDSTASFWRLFQRHRPDSVIGRIEIPQCSDLLPEPCLAPSLAGSCMLAPHGHHSHLAGAAAGTDYEPRCIRSCIPLRLCRLRSKTDCRVARGFKCSIRTMGPSWLWRALACDRPRRISSGSLLSLPRIPFGTSFLPR